MDALESDITSLLLGKGGGFDYFFGLYTELSIDQEIEYLRMLIRWIL